MSDHPAAAFDGGTFDEELDAPRLSGQLPRVREFMREHFRRYHTLAEIRAAIQWRGSEAAISARIRDLRKSKCGAYTMDRRRRGEGRAGLWEYAMIGDAGTWQPVEQHCPHCQCACERCSSSATAATFALEEDWANE